MVSSQHKYVCIKHLAWYEQYYFTSEYIYVVVEVIVRASTADFFHTAAYLMSYKWSDRCDLKLSVVICHVPPALLHIWCQRIFWHIQQRFIQAFCQHISGIAVVCLHPGRVRFSAAVVVYSLPVTVIFRVWQSVRLLVPLPRALGKAQMNEWVVEGKNFTMCM